MAEVFFFLFFFFFMDNFLYILSFSLASNNKYLFQRSYVSAQYIITAFIICFVYIRRQHLYSLNQYLHSVIPFHWETLELSASITIDQLWISGTYK